jgi:biopolymer transport protein ExbD
MAVSSACILAIAGCPGSPEAPAKPAATEAAPAQPTTEQPDAPTPQDETSAAKPSTQLITIMIGQRGKGENSRPIYAVRTDKDKEILISPPEELSVEEARKTASEKLLQVLSDLAKSAGTDAQVVIRPEADLAPETKPLDIEHRYIMDVAEQAHRAGFDKIHLLVQTPAAGETLLVPRPTGLFISVVPPTRAAPDKRNVRMFTTSVQADEVVYVVDSSGSMAAEGAFDLLQLDLAESIAALDESKKFHLIFFRGREPIENSPRKLVAATAENKLQVGEFLDGIIPEKETLVLAALSRAFDVLKAGDPKARKVIFLVSDGGFEGYAGSNNEYKDLTGNKAVLAWLYDNNRKVKVRDAEGHVAMRREVQICTFLYHGKDPEAAKVMKEIATWHDGEFTHIGADE